MLNTDSKDITTRPEAQLRYGDRTYRFQGFMAGDYIFEQVKKLGTYYELATLEFIKSRRLSGTYVDVGANVGNHSLFFLQETNCDRLVAIEGNQSLIPIWNLNIHSNLQCIKPYRLVNEFVSNEKELFFNADPGENIGSSFLSRVRLGEDSVEIKARSLDSMLSEIQDVTLLKVDVEGHEVEVLKSAEHILRTQSPEICAEALFTSEEDLVRFLANFGYLPLASLSNGNLYFSKFPGLARTGVRCMAWLAYLFPQPLAYRIIWRLVRYGAVFSGLLPLKMFRQFQPNYHSLLIALGLENSE